MSMDPPQGDLPFYREALRRLVTARIAELSRPQNEAELALLESDLAHIQAPDFGRCETCAAAIDFARLLADPGIRYCGRCGQHYFWEQDVNYRFVWRVGTAYERQQNPMGSIVGKTRWELPSLNMREEDWARHRADLDARRAFRDLLICRPTPSGAERWISISGRPIFDESGAFKGYRGYARELPGPPAGR